MLQSKESQKIGQNLAVEQQQQQTKRKRGKMDPEGREVAEALQHGAGSAFTAQHLNAC